MSMYAAVKALDRYPTAGTKFRARFDLVRHSSRLECVWTCDDGFVITADFADRDPGRWSARDTLSVIDPFVEAIEEGLRPDPVPDGFEVWRFDHASIGVEVADHGSLEVIGIREALWGVLDETFNAPSLYDARDLRRPFS